MKKLMCVLLIFACTFCLYSCNERSADVPQEQSGLSMPKPQGKGNGGVKAQKSESVTERVSFVGCGDNIIYLGNTRDAKSLAVPGGRTYNFKPMYENVAHIIKDADIAFINQETVMAGDSYAVSYYPMFNSPRDLGYDLCELGYDVVNIANNHMLDKGTGGLESTIEFWKSLDCLMIGGYENRADYDTVRTLEKNGINIAFLSYTFDTNGITKSASSDVVIPYINETDIKRQVALAKEAAEFVVVSVHWGQENVFEPCDEQVETARLLADCGADVIIGHHPHVIQKVEWLYGKDGNKTLCVYSLGNFAAEQACAYNMFGGIIRFDIVSVDNGKPYLENVVFEPTVFHFPKSFYGNKIYLLGDYTQELASQHGVSAFYGNRISCDMLKKYATTYISEEFLPEYLRK